MCISGKKEKYTVQVKDNHEIAPGIFEMVFEQKRIAAETKPGQFINLYCNSNSRLLPRPISICEVNKADGWVKVVYAAVGAGTKEFSQLKEGDSLNVLGPLGNGFSIEDSKENIIIGGGVGTPPLLELVKQLKGNNKIILGFRDNPYLMDAFSKYGEVFVATDTGNAGYKGTVIDVLNELEPKGERIYACGPKPMLKALKEWSSPRNIPAQLSLEERMGCGFGACVGCAVKIKEDNEIGYTNKKVCKDGPVFWAKEIMFE